VNAIRVERIRAQQMTAEESARTSGFAATLWSDLLKKAEALFTWILLLGLLAVLVLVVLAIPRWRRPKPEMLISFADRTTDKPTDAANLILSQEVARLLGPSDGLSTESLTADSVGNRNGTTFVNLQPLWNPGYLETALNSGAALDLGVFKITPQAFLQFLKTAFREKYAYTLEGVVSSSGKTTMISVRMLDAKGERIQGCVWTVTADGDDARETALRDVVARVLIQHPTTLTSTGLWESLSYFQRAMDVFRTDESSTQVGDAQGYLQKALKHDPSNWMARYNNALFLQQEGDCEASLENWLILLDTLGSSKCPPSLVEYLRSHPELVNNIEYNHALTLGKLERLEENHRATKMLRNLTLIASGDLQCLAQSALAATLSWQFEHQFARTMDALVRQQSTIPEKEAATKTTGNEQGVKPLKPPDPRAAAVKATETIGAEIDAITEALIERLIESQHVSKSLTLAVATARNARGVVHLTRSEYKAAMEDFRVAMVRDPEFLEPMLNAAKALRRQKQGDWVSQVQAYLENALKLDGDNKEAHFLLGSLFSDPRVFRLEQAANHFEAADPHSWAAYGLGDLFANPSFVGANRNKALENYRKSVRLADVTDQRTVTLTKLLLSLAERIMARQVTRTGDGPRIEGDPSKPTFDALQMAEEALQLSRNIIRASRGAHGDARGRDLEAQALKLIEQIKIARSKANGAGSGDRPEIGTELKATVPVVDAESSGNLLP
jgi:tetratricopeptide (TPR) repeat protein